MKFEPNQKGPIKDAFAKLITLENIAKLIALLMSLKAEPAGEARMMADEPAVAEVTTALEAIPAEDRQACVEECLNELVEEGRVRFAA